MTDEPMKMILVNKLDPMSEYIDFGKYALSLKQLQKNRFMLRTKAKKNPVLSFRTLTLSRKTKAIVQKLLQDVEVTFEEVDALNEDERNIINQLGVVLLHSFSLPSETNPFFSSMGNDISEGCEPAFVEAASFFRSSAMVSALPFSLIRVHCLLLLMACFPVQRLALLATIRHFLAN